jgi:hypothetical protein
VLLLLLAAATASAHPTKYILSANTIPVAASKQHAAAGSSSQGTVPPMNPPVLTDFPQQEGINTEGPWPLAEDADKFMVDFSLEGELLTEKKPHQPGLTLQAVQPAAAAAEPAAKRVYVDKWPADEAAVMAAIIQDSFEAEPSSSSSSSSGSSSSSSSSSNEGPWPLANDADQHILQDLLDFPAELPASGSSSSRSQQPVQPPQERQEALHASAIAKDQIPDDVAAALHDYQVGSTAGSTPGSTVGTIGSIASRIEDLQAVYDELLDEEYYDDIISSLINNVDYTGDTDYLFEDLGQREHLPTAAAVGQTLDNVPDYTADPSLSVTVITDAASNPAPAAAAAAAAAEEEVQQAAAAAAVWEARSAAAKWHSSSAHHTMRSSSSSSSVRRLLGMSDFLNSLFRITPAEDDTSDDKPKKGSGGSATTPQTPPTEPSLIVQVSPGPVTVLSPAPEPQVSPAPPTTVTTPGSGSSSSSGNATSTPGNPGSTLPQDPDSSVTSDTGSTAGSVTGTNGTIISAPSDIGADNSSSIDTSVPAKPLEPQPGEVLPAGLQQQMQQQQQAATAPLVKGTSVNLPVAVDTVTLSFIVRGEARFGSCCGARQAVKLPRRLFNRTALSYAVLLLT